MKKGFTLLELLIVMAVLAILASILLVVVKPQQIFSKARDTQRKSDMRNLQMALETYLTEAGSSPNLAFGSVTANASCVGGSGTVIVWTSAGSGTTVTPPSGFGKLNASSTIGTDGTGWLPVNFAGVASLNLSALPVDPTNSATDATPSLYYSYACKTNSTYELDANLENMTADETSDGGNNNALYEAGTDKTIIPAGTTTSFYPGA